MANVVRRTYLRVTIDGTDDTTAYAATISYGLDQRWGEATVYRTGGGSISIGYWSVVEIYMSTSPDGFGTTPWKRFTGYAIPIENVLFPIQNILHCRGLLYKAEFVRMMTSGGARMTAAVYNTAGTGTTDQQQVKDVLDACSVTYTSGNILGTSKNELGTTFIDFEKFKDPGPFTWAEGESGLSYIERLDAVSVPDSATGRYRTYETPPNIGGVFRTLLNTVPATLADYTYTEGTDVLEARIIRDPTGSANRITVTGASRPFDVEQDGTDVTLGAAVRYTLASATAPYLPSGLPNGPDGYPEVQHTQSSPMIEKALIADTFGAVSSVFSCEALAGFLLAEYNTVVDTIEFSTPRDDDLYPGATIHLTSTRLGLTDSTRHYVLQRVELSVDENGALTQRLTCQRRS